MRGVTTVVSAMHFFLCAEPLGGSIYACLAYAEPLFSGFSLGSRLLCIFTYFACMRRIFLCLFLRLQSSGDRSSIHIYVSPTHGAASSIDLFSAPIFGVAASIHFLHVWSSWVAASMRAWRLRSLCCWMVFGRAVFGTISYPLHPWGVVFHLFLAVAEPRGGGASMHTLHVQTP